MERAWAPEWPLERALLRFGPWSGHLSGRFKFSRIQLGKLVGTEPRSGHLAVSGHCSDLVPGVATVHLGGHCSGPGLWELSPGVPGHLSGPPPAQGTQHCSSIGGSGHSLGHFSWSDASGPGLTRTECFGALGRVGGHTESDSPSGRCRE